MKLNKYALPAIIWALVTLLFACSPDSSPVEPLEEPEYIPAPVFGEKPAITEVAPEVAALEQPEDIAEPVPEEKSSPEEAVPETASDGFDAWWEEFKRPFHHDTSQYPAFFRGAWASRLDETRSYLLNADKLREAGFDTILLGVDVVFNPDTGDAVSLGDNIFIFYLQALKRAGFRVILIPNPMHPNLDIGEGYEWDAPDPDARYHRSYQLISKISPVVIKWAGIAEEYHADGFVHQ